MMDEMTPELDLPGFRFHPTEEELLDFYLKNMVYGKRLRFDIIGYLNIYHHDPWDLPGLAKIGEREWYFFVPRDRKHGSGGRPSRTTETGFWKATGSDRKIVKLSDPKRIIGLKKTLVFYKGRAPRGFKTDWVMNEYRLPDSSSPLPSDIVLCKIYRKATSLKVLEQRAAMEEEMKTIHSSPPPPPPSSSPVSSSLDTISFCSPQEDIVAPTTLHNPMLFKKEAVEDRMEMITDNASNNIGISSIVDEKPKEIKGYSLQLPIGKDNLPELQLPKLIGDWSMDPACFSPWFQNLTPYNSILNISQ